jgi:hypothetical protein
MNPSSMKFQIKWHGLGWWPASSERVGRAPSPLPQAKAGDRVAFLVVAPWCPDCQELVAGFEKSPWARRVVPERTWVVGEFDSEASVSEFASVLGLPLLFGTVEKSVAARNEARFGEIRRYFGDSRTWGVPSWLEAEVQSEGSLLFDRAEWPAD